MSDPKNEKVFSNEIDSNKKIEIIPAAKQDNIDIDTTNQLLDNIINAGRSGKIDLASIESFTSVSNSRNQLYDLLDMMSSDGNISAVLETYAEDSTEYNDQSTAVWAESADASVAKYVNRLLDILNIDKHIYNWAYCLCKYGDLYIRLYRKSDEELPDFGEKKVTGPLNEGVTMQVHKEDDHYNGYIDMIKNPAEMFELLKFGKTQGYIKTDVTLINSQQPNVLSGNTFYQQFRFNSSDINIYGADDFVHACLEDNSSRVEEEVKIFTGINSGDSSGDDKVKQKVNSADYSYKVRRGKSILYDSFRTWRELSLLESSVLLNRITKSSVLRIISVEVGNMPKEAVGSHLQGIKQLMEQKAAIKTDGGITEYTNPGAIENNIYVPTHDGVGVITPSQVGGDVNVGDLTDLDYYQNKLYGGLKVPKQYLGLTEDSTGFNGGTSLTLLSSRYAKTVKKIQASLIGMVTDIVNLMLIDKGFTGYINQFTIKMQAPTTQEAKDRQESVQQNVNMVRDIMGELEGIENPQTKLKILKSLLSNVITNTEVIELIEEEIDRLGSGKNEEEDITSNEEDHAFSSTSFGRGSSGGNEADIFSDLGNEEETGNETEETPEEGETNPGRNSIEGEASPTSETPAPEEEATAESFNTKEGEKVLLEEPQTKLPSAEDLGLDLTDTEDIIEKE